LSFPVMHTSSRDLIDPSPFILIPAAPETSAWEWSD